MKNFDGRPRRPFKRQKHTLRNIILAFMGIVLIAVGSLFTVAYLNTKDAIDKTHVNLKTNKTRNVSKVLREGKPVSILLMGTDTGDLGREDTGRTDSLILATINPKTKKTNLVSIPRDSMVSPVGSPAAFPQKLNAVYEYSPDGDIDGSGHPESTIKTIEKWLNVPIDFYALVNMNALKDVVDAIGGIDIVPPLSFDYEGASFTEGIKQHVNGFEALKFARMRYDDPQGDYGRTMRQRIILEAIAKNIPKIATNVLNKTFMNKLSSSARTDLTFDDMLTLVSKYRDATKKIKSDHIQGVGYPFGGQSFEMIPLSEKQRATDLLRKGLSLKAADTGTDFGGTVLSGYEIDLDNEYTASFTTEATATSDSSEDYGYGY